MTSSCNIPLPGGFPWAGGVCYCPLATSPVVSRRAITNGNVHGRFLLQRACVVHTRYTLPE